MPDQKQEANLDDLTRIPGIGQATARRLSDAGIDGFQALAAAFPDTLAEHPALRGVRASPADLHAWIAAAAELAAAPGEGSPGTVLQEQAPGHGTTTQPPMPGAVPPVTRGTDPEIWIVTGPARGRWRAGRRFTAEPQRLALAELTDAERLAIEGDTTLTVVAEPEA